MNLLIGNIEKLLNESISLFIEKICDKYDNVDIEELKNLWNNESVIKKSAIKDKPKLSTKKNTESKESKDDGCPYIFSKGEKSGNICGSKPKTDSEYCSRHQKYEGVGQTKKSETKKKVIL